MTSPGVFFPRLLFTVLFHVFFSRLLLAQLISIKTVPIAQGDQFEIFPSQNLAMGGVSIAVPDTLLDPFRNPAKGARLAVAPRFFGSPTFYGVSSGAGGGRTLRSEEHTSELQSRFDLVCRLLLEKKKQTKD